VYPAAPLADFLEGADDGQQLKQLHQRGDGLDRHALGFKVPDTGLDLLGADAERRAPQYDGDQLRMRDERLTSPVGVQRKPHPPAVVLRPGRCHVRQGKLSDADEDVFLVLKRW
jgi:hypothetical protein